MRILEDAVVRLEPQVASHAPAMFEVLSDPAIYEHENAPPISVEWLRRRYERLETRASPDGAQRWLNWVIRVPSGDLIGYVQATLCANHLAWIAYELNSRWWGRGLASAAVRLMCAELATAYGITVLAAALKSTNARSRRLLERNGFALAPDALRAGHDVEPDELLMLRPAAMPATDAAGARMR
jgi:RimJ/RimL family protein N-acetyltransferase